MSSKEKLAIIDVLHYILTDDPYRDLPHKDFRKVLDDLPPEFLIYDQPKQSLFHARLKQHVYFTKPAFSIVSCSTHLNMGVGKDNNYINLEINVSEIDYYLYIPEFLKHREVKYFYNKLVDNKESMRRRVRSENEFIIPWNKYTFTKRKFDYLGNLLEK